MKISELISIQNEIKPLITHVPGFARKGLSVLRTLPREADTSGVYVPLEKYEALYWAGMGEYFVIDETDYEAFNSSEASYERMWEEIGLDIEASF